MPIYTQKINQTEAGLEIIHMIDGEPDPCSDCWKSCQGCRDKLKDKPVAVTGEHPSILDGINWE